MVRIEVNAPAHVHVGNVDLHGGLGRLYGTLGFALVEPRLRLVVEESDGVVVEGTTRSDFRRLAEEVSGYYGVGLRIRVVEEIPANVGLGSTTPYALGVAAAASLIARGAYDLEEAARVTRRARVSGLGFYSFKMGGFIVDGGFVPGREGIPPLIFRAHVPAKYRIVYLVPNARLEEILEIKRREDEVLSSLPPMSEEMAMRNSRLVLMGIMPSVAEGDWKRAGEHLTALNSGLGDYWEVRQPGRYCCSEVGSLVGVLLDNGALCACQSSWGPTVYALVEGEGKASMLLERALDYGAGLGLEFIAYGVTRVDNRGAILRVMGDG